MKRDFDEISDDEWENHSFNSSRVLKNPPPPPIESFAFGSNLNQLKQQQKQPIVAVNLSDDDDCFEIKPKSLPNPPPENLEDDDVEMTVPPANRGRRFVVEEDDEEEENSDAEWADLLPDEDKAVKDSVEEVEEEENVVKKALHKCSKISMELRKELYGPSAAAPSYRYAEVEASSVRVVTQDDVYAACSVKESDFQPVLKPYQLVGVNFLFLLYRKGVGGAILADEMGLGKTIQAITYLIMLKHLDNDPGPHLIVCPVSLLENWERELKRWCPSFSVLQYHGAAKSAYSKQLKSLGKAGQPPPFNVLLASYSLFERRSMQQKDDRKVLKRWRWSCVLLDEAHALKDRTSYRWKNLMPIARNSNQRLMLTGTPLQNDLHELWSLLEFIMPDLFATGDVDLKKLLNAEDRNLISHMKSIMGPFILRRLKSDVMQQLVQKIQKVEYVSMEKDQDDAYKEAIEEYRAASRASFAKLSEASSNNVAMILPRRQISNYFVQFRKIANHPLLVRRIYSDEDVVRFAKSLHPMGAFGFECTVERVIEELKNSNDFSIHQLLLYNGINDSKGTLTDEHVMLSAKCRALSKLIPSLKQKGHRVLIFSQWTSMLDILEWTLEVIGVTYRRLDGGTQVAERQNIVDSFNGNTSIFACLLSTRAGGQGLNLTGADTVIIHDMDFNPQVDRQAEDRCHRIGQTKPVTIYRLVTKGTVDENVYEIAKRKLVLDAAVLESGVVVEEAGDISERTMGEILSSLLLV